MRIVSVCVLVLAVHQIQAQQGLTRASFTTSWIANEKLLTDIYAGNFADIEMERSDVRFHSLYHDYLMAYGRRCDTYLPTNKVEIMETVCAREQTRIDRYGTRVGTGTCAEYITRGTGIYADPVLYATGEKFGNEVGVDTIRGVFRSMAGKNPLGTAL